MNQPLKHNVHQKRDSSFSLQPVRCAGLDGSPWPREAEDRRREIKEQQEEDKEYFKHHKASPLSDMKIAETRKPITQATDGTARSSKYGAGGGGVIGWLP